MWLLSKEMEPALLAALEPCWVSIQGEQPNRGVEDRCIPPVLQTCSTVPTSASVKPAQLTSWDDADEMYCLYAGKKLVVLRVRADPEPVDGVTVAQTEGAPAEANAHRIDRFSLVDLSKAQARVVWIIAPEPIGASSTVLHVERQGAKRIAKVISTRGFHGSSKPPGVALPARTSARTLAARLASLS